MIEIIKDKQNWNDTIKRIGHSDFYHSYYYHQLSKKDGETPILIYYSEVGTLIALPLLLREIEDTLYYDATSVYGYSGPLFRTDDLNFNNSKFRKELQVLLKELKIVSIFSRLHPYIEYQESILSGIGDVFNCNDVVNIDLTDPLELQRQKYSRRLKTYINKARRYCSVVEGKTEDDLQAFIQLYYGNMKRVNANLNYFFDEVYFHKLVLGCNFETELLLVVLEETGEIISGAIFVKTGNIVQYHLSGTKEEYLYLNPLKLLIDEMRIKATKENFTHFNLGGGKANNEGSLFAFKSSFSKSFKTFKLWNYIVDKKVYDVLVRREREKLGDEIFQEDERFFPAYRQFTIAI